MLERKAYAKINLTLAVTGKRPDGYHTLASVMQEITLCDLIRAEKAPEGIHFRCDEPSLPADEKNLCVRAAKAYLDAAGNPGGVTLELEKKIPAGAGLGGGSSDAASTLTLLSELYPADVDLFALAAALGADVPFFLTGGTCLCTGIGEIVQPLFFPAKEALWCVVAQEDAPLSTPAVYKAYDELAPERERPSITEVVEAMTWGDPEAVYPFLFNDLEAPAYTLMPGIRETRNYLKALNADATLMTGSGSAVFALFRQQELAAWAAANIKKKGAKTFLCRLI